MNYSSRLALLRAAFSDLNCDAVVIANLTNVRYLCGFTGSAGMAVITSSKAFFITDFRYQQQAALQVPPEYSVVVAKKGLWPEAAKILRKSTKIGFEAEHTSVAAWEENKKVFSPRELVATSRIVENGEESGRRYTRSIQAGEAGRPALEHWLVHGAGHAWSGGSRSGSYADPLGPDASREMLRFFLRPA